MQNPQWIGTSPSQPFWSPDGQRLYFFWNPEKATSDSLYFISLKNKKPQKATLSERKTAFAERNGNFNSKKTKLVYTLDHALRILNISNKSKKTLFTTTQEIYHPAFGKDRVFFQIGNDLYTYHLSTGSLEQLIHFEKGKSSEKKKKQSARSIFLKEDALENSAVLRRRKKKKEASQQEKEKLTPQFSGIIYTGDKQVDHIVADPRGQYIVYRLHTKVDNQPTKVPDYVTENGYVKDITSRPKVGIHHPQYKSYIYDTQEDTSYAIKTNKIPGIKDIPAFYKNYPKIYDSLRRDSSRREVILNGPKWNREGTKAVVVIRSFDHKDRWIMELDATNGKLNLLDRQHDSAWIAGPGIGYTYQMGNLGWVDANHIWYQSEKSGYSHLYIQDVNTGKIQTLTRGKFEVQSAQLSPDRTTFYITTNQSSPGEKQFYHLAIKTKEITRITQQKGGNEVKVSPDGKQIAFLHSTAIHPWELYLKKNKKKATAEQITHKAESKLYQSYSWRKPIITTFKDRDSLSVYTEIYKPEKQATTHPGVIFVHGAGYLQDVKDYWSYYFREHMFINMLVDQGYTVMNIDYRGSAGYGRDWRTAIYRHMGGNDLEDIVDGAKYMSEHLNVNKNKIGIWGGSYGGFMTLMALFKTNTFACGAALRSVTDWAHYNHGYTSNILNQPQNDSIAYVQSSPIYFAKGLHDPLLMCHGMIDTNVHFQDIIRLSEKLIELKKNNWQLAVYPVESHGFIEPESWRDEYYRIYQLFEKYLK